MKIGMFLLFILASLAHAKGSPDPIANKPAEKPGTILYQVEKKNWLADILRQKGYKPLWGKNGYVEKTLHLNDEIINDPKNIKPGTWIYIPTLLTPLDRVKNLVKSEPVPTPSPTPESAPVVTPAATPSPSVAPTATPEPVVVKPEPSPEPASETNPSFLDHIAGSLGLSGSIGTLENTKAGLPSRTVDTFSVEGLLGYQTHKWIFGIDLDYGVQYQFKPPIEIGSDLGGSRLLLGLGVLYLMSDHFTVQAAVTALGNMNFSYMKSYSTITSFNQPIGMRLKPQYHLFGNAISLDLDLQYLKWQSLTSAGKSVKNPATQTMVGLGLSYYFGSSESSDEVAERLKRHEREPR